MEEFGAIFGLVSLAGVLVIAVILLGPSLLSSYENWKIRRGFCGYLVSWSKQKRFR